MSKKTYENRKFESKTGEKELKAGNKIVYLFSGRLSTTFNFSNNVF